MRQFLHDEGEKWKQTPEWVRAGKRIVPYDSPLNKCFVELIEYCMKYPEVKSVFITREKKRTIFEWVHAEYNSFPQFGLATRLKNGYYSPTPLAFDFYAGRVAIPARVYWMSGKCIGVSVEKIFIHQVPDEQKPRR